MEIYDLIDLLIHLRDRWIIRGFEIQQQQEKNRKYPFIMDIKDSY